MAEGVETVQELKTVIRLGVDLIQGYYTSKPKPLFLNSISKEIKDEIIKTNLETRPDGVKKIYAAQNDSELDLLKLALEKYTDIHIYQSKLTIIGDPDKPIKMNITVVDNHSCELTLKNVNMVSGNSKPAICVGEYARLVLNVVKNNKLSYAGILVPNGAQFELGGKGNLTIDCYASEGIGIGNDYDHGYGDITLGGSGNLEIISNSVDSVCIGGGFNDDESEINILSGKLKLSAYCHNGLGTGSFNGDAIVNISDNASIEITLSGISVTGVGSCKGIATITSSADISVSCTGANSVGIGVLEDGEGSVYIKKGKVSLKMRSGRHTCIGAIKGSVNTKVKDAEIHIDSEGDEMTGIGDAQGTGNVSVIDSSVNMRVFAGNPTDIGTSGGDLQIQNSTINSLINNQPVAH